MNTGKERLICKLKVASAMSCLVLLGRTAHSETIYYKGPGGDLADPANWSASSWTSADTLVVSTNGAGGTLVSIPANGFSLSGDMPANAKLWFNKLPDRDVFFNTAGHRLNTAELDFNKLHAHDSGKLRRLIFTGGFTNVTKITYTGSYGHAAFSNGVFCVENSFCLHEWWAYLRILKDAELRICRLNGNATLGCSAYASYPEMTVDGGRFRIAAHDNPDSNWRITLWQHGSNNSTSTKNVHVTNGGEYIDDTTYPQDQFQSAINVLIDNGGAYIATNSTKSNRNTMWGSKGTFAVSNGIFRVAQLYLGKLQSGGDFQNETAPTPIGSTLLFHNSKELFAFAPSSSLKSGGIIVSPAAKNNRLRFSGDENAYHSHRFPLGGVSNVVEVAGGEFAVSNSLQFINGNDNRLRLTGGRTWLGALNYSTGSTNASVEVSDTASLHLNWDSSFGGVSNRFVVTGGHFDMGAYWLNLNGEGFRVDVTGGASTSAVCFAANDTRMFVGSGTTHVAPLEPGWYGHDCSLWFTSGKANQVLVISNGTFECGKPFFSGKATAADRVASSDQQNTEAVPFTNCPNSRIEFRGDNPAFVITSAQQHGTAGSNWHQFALGGTIDPVTGNWTRRPYKLDNPVRLRFCVPKNGYAQAPFRALTQCGGSLGGNAEFDFDMSAFAWPLRRTRIPLVYAASGYAAWGGKDVRYLNINVDGLNETNADRLPTNPQTGRKAKLVLEDDGKTLSLQVPGTAGLTILVR